MGIMLENISERLLAPGAAHDRAPDKVPSRRLRVIEAAGELRIPFTTGILIGIGETLEERVDSLSRYASCTIATGTSKRSSSRTSAPSPPSAWQDAPDPTFEDLQRTRGGRAALARAARQPPGAAQPVPRDLSRASFARVSTTGEASRL